MTELAQWLADRAEELTALGDPEVWGFADAVQGAASRLARGEITQAEAVDDVMARRATRRLVRP